MVFTVFLHPRASTYLEDMDEVLRDRIRKKLLTLSQMPERGERLKLSDFWRLRIGDYRAIYEIDSSQNRVIVLFIGHRKDVYDDFSRLL